MDPAQKPFRVPPPRRRPLAPFIVLGVSLLATAAAALYVGAESSENDRTHFEHLAERTQTSIVRRLDTYINLLRGGTGLFASSTEVSAQQFRTYATRLALDEHYPGVQGIGVTIRMPAEQLPVTLEQLRRQPELTNLAITPAGERPEYHAIIYLEPLDERNAKAIGYDMFTDPTRREAMERARDTAEPAMSGKVTLVQETVGDGSPPGFLIYVPFYSSPAIPLGIDDRRRFLAGFVYSPFRVDDLLQGIFGARTPHGMAFALYDGEQSTPESLLYQSDAGEGARAGADNDDAPPRFIKRTRVKIAGHPWTLVFHTQPEFESTSSRGFTVLVIAMGAVVSLVLFTISFGQSTARARAEQTADDLRESERALRASESKFRRLADSNLVGVCFAETSGRITDANEALLNILGRSIDEVKRGTVRWDSITPSEYRAADERALAQLKAGGVCTPYEKQYLRPDGSRVPVLVGSAMLEGDRGDAVGVVIDLTERNRSLEALKAARDAANAARAEAEDANRVKDEFLATVSHELRTPLNAILGWAQILREGATDPDELSQGLATIERNAKAQAQLVEDLLDVSRIVSGKLRLDMKKVQLQGVIEAAIESVRPGADAKGVAIHPVLDPATGPVSGDPDRLQQIVWNLLSNAVKFTPRGGSVQVLLQRSDGNAEVAVTDTGRGISREFLPHVFDRFRQGDAGITRQFGGLGLGLGIVRHLVELHGGTVSAISLGEGKGATFVVTLPLLVVQPQPDRSETLTTRRPPSGDCPPLTLAGLRVLVVEDDADSRQLLDKILRDCGAEVSVASSAAEGFSAFVREPPDILVSDIGLPEEDGYSLLKRVRAAETGDARVPAIALTALARAEDRRRALLAGYQMHLAKPVEPGELRMAIADLAGRSPIGA